MAKQQQQDYKTFNNYLKSVKIDAEFQKARYEAMYYYLEGNKIRQEYYDLLEKEKLVQNNIPEDLKENPVTEAFKAEEVEVG